MSRQFPTHASLVESIGAAEGAWSRQDWSAALDAYGTILRGRLEDLREASSSRDAGFRAADIVVVERLADLAVPFGHFRAADWLLEGYVALAQGAGNLMAADYAALKRVRLALGQEAINAAVERLQAMDGSLGDLDDIELSAKALPGWEAARPWSGLDRADRAVLFSRLYLELGRLFACLGRYTEALAALDRGVAHATARHAPDLARRAALPLGLERAAARLERGDLDKARATLDEIQSLADLRTDPVASIRLGELAGKLAALHGDLGAARDRLAGVVHDSRARGFRRAAAIAALNLAHMLILLNQTARARALVAEASSAAREEEGGEIVAARAAMLAALASARGTSLAEGVAIAPAVIQQWAGRGGRPEAAPRSEGAAASSVLDDRPQAANYLAFFEDRALAFLAGLAVGDPEAAARDLDHLDQCFEATDSKLIGLRRRVLRGYSEYYRARYDEAAALLFPAVGELDQLGLRPDLWQALRVLGWSLAKQGDTASQAGALLERAQRLLDAMTRTLAEEDRPILLLNKWTSEEEYIVSRIDLVIQERKAVEQSPWPIRPWRRWKHWERLDELLQFLDRFKVDAYRQGVGASSGPAAEGSSAPRPVPLWRKLLHHPWRRAVLSFVVLPDRVFLACSNWGRLDFGVSPVTRLEVRSKIKDWHDAVRQYDHSGSMDAADRALADLAESLQFGRLLDRLPRRVRALTIVPDDSLHGLPFAVLKHRGAYLIERFALNLGVSREPVAAPAAPRNSAGVVLVGSSGGSDRLPPLPGVAHELDAVQGWLGRRGVAVERLQDAHAGRTAVLAALGRAQIAHLACHGVFRPDQPDSSGLVFIPQPDRVELLSLRDLAAAKLSNLRHATLSACWSADGFILPGRRAISLPETLCRSGVDSVLGSLWPVDDSTVSAFMGRFYAHLTRHPAERALRLAQLDMLRGVAGNSDPFVSHPIAWAGYTLTGRPGRVRIR
jgi:hypothetical protein